jgi:MFS family permease
VAAGKFSTKGACLFNIGVIALLPLFGHPKLPIFTSERMWTFNLAAVVFGVSNGGLLALSRSLYARFIPKGKEHEYFGFYEITDKGTSWLGPLVVGIVINATGDPSSSPPPRPTLPPSPFPPPPLLLSPPSSVCALSFTVHTPMQYRSQDRCAWAFSRSSSSWQWVGPSSREWTWRPVLKKLGAVVLPQSRQEAKAVALAVMARASAVAKPPPPHRRGSHAKMVEAIGRGGGRSCVACPKAKRWLPPGG